MNKHDWITKTHNKFQARSYSHLLMALALVATIVVNVGVVAAETTWYVDDDGGLGIDFLKIQDAVNAAGDGDTIIVYGGIYYECLIIYKSLILQGENRETTIVDANGSSRGIEITADDCVISGFTIRNCWDTGIKLSSSSNGSTITNNIIHSIIGSSDTDGIEVTISSHNVISNNEIFDCDDEGIEFDGSSYNTVTNNTIHSITEDAIDVRGSSYNHIANNTIYSNGNHGISLGRSWDVEPVIWGSSHNTITSNDIHLNGGDGIQLTNSSHNSVTNNYVFSNSDDGIGINEHSSNNFVTDNNVFSNSNNGIDIEDSSNNNIMYNFIYLNNHDGIDLEGTSSYNVITTNNIFDDGSNGINIKDYSSYNSITNNDIFNNSDDGIDVVDSASNNMIIDNYFYLNGNAGVRIELSNNNQIYHNNFINNVNQADDNGNNFWDNGYPSCGNYWSDYTGIDTDGDGIGDIPYIIGGSAGAQDKYPFMNMNGWQHDTSLLFAITPNSRIVQIGTPATIFLSAINAGTETATDVSISQASSLPATICYQMWDGATLTGTPDTPVDIGSGEIANFVMTITPTAEFSSSSLTFDVSSTNGASAPISGVNTLTISASSVPYADIIMISTALDVSTPVNTPTAFAIATTNVGTADATGVSLVVDIPQTIDGLSYEVYETYPGNGSIKGSAMGLTIPVGAQPTFAVFLTPTEPITFDPANNRIMLKLVDGSGTVVGAQSVAVSTI